MLKIRFIQNNGEERIVETYAGPTLMEAASAAGVEGIEAICGGSCICGTCQVYIEGDFAAVGPPGEDELVVLGETGVQRHTSRLSCQIKVSESFDGVTFTVAPPRKG